ncbi:MAG: YqeG family HAD IIIA-type phosphatase [Peptococcaceae bacterium]|nr:YqeG family HAD IIIA-type phosphatase [Peptococcaceae bacterium]
MAFWTPDYEVTHVRDISVDMLRQAGIQGLLIDVDNTIAPWRQSPTPDIKEWLANMDEAGIQLCILSNNRHPTRVKHMAEDLGILFIARAGKPRRRGYARAQQLLNLQHHEVAVVGDQIFTDIMGGKRAGVKTILVTPLPGGELPALKILRFVERLVGRKSR